MLQVVEWNSYTFRSYRDQCRKNVDACRAALEEAERQLVDAEVEFEVMERRGMADASLPSHFGSILLARDFRKGLIPEGMKVGENIERLAAEMGDDLR